ncbi:MAG TPA: polysaccharide deacetylase family protein [Gemmatimonadales bacterium]|jgi:peptidoglycan/xylan/chitin deacetylase (PgdA/CDA1 family)
MTVRTGLKQAVESLLIGAGVAGVSRARLRRRSLVLAYHNIVPDDAPPTGDRSLHLSQSRFAAQLDELARHADVVPLDKVFNRPAGERPRVAITFDDAYFGAVSLGLDELARRGLSATVFAAPGLLAGHAFWWDALAEPGADLAPEIRRHALVSLRGQDDAIRRWSDAGGRRAAELPAYARSASEDQLRRAIAGGSFTVGSHTWSHPSLPRLSRGEVTTELVRSRDWLVARFGSAWVPWLSYPYGHFSPMVTEEAAAAGYRGALAIEGGWIPESAWAQYAVPRLNIPAGLSERGFALRAAGLFCR